MFNNVLNSRSVDLYSPTLSKKRPISEVSDDFEDRVGGLANPVLEVAQKDTNVVPLSKKIKTTEMVDTDETMEITDPRAKGLLEAICDKGLQKVLIEVENHNTINEMIIKVLTTIHSIDSNTPILQSINPEVRDANFYEIGMKNAIKILNFVQEIENQYPGHSQQFASEILNSPVEAESMNSEELLVGMADLSQALEDFSW
ncbi:MAG: hypothetical protein S4CHLAM123_14210 [Chlamydiales bacterium]|nr:hypothetical protein [Chlamydiales bacterium]